MFTHQVVEYDAFGEGLSQPLPKEVVASLKSGDDEVLKAFAIEEFKGETDRSMQSSQRGRVACTRGTLRRTGDCSAASLPQEPLYVFIVGSWILVSLRGKRVEWVLNPLLPKLC